MKNKRNFGLDLLRAASISGVFLAHGVTAMSRLGIGVDLFFVLSGFLIGRIYFRSRRDGSFRLREFWVARWWRTLPPYFAALALFALSEHWFPGNPVDWRYLFFLQTVNGVTGFGPSWSLCVEEHFYLFMPLVLLAAEGIFGRKALRWLFPIAFLSPLALRAGMMLWLGSVDAMPNQWYRMTPLHCDGLIAGCYLAYLYVEQPAWFARIRPLAWIGLPLFAVAFLLTTYVSGTIGYESLSATLYALAFACFLRLAYDISWQPASFLGRWTERTVRGIAIASYSIYLVHTLAMIDVRILLDSLPRGAFKSTAILVPTILLSVLFYYLVEKPSIVSRNWYLSRQIAEEKAANSDSSPISQVDSSQSTEARLPEPTS